MKNRPIRSLLQEGRPLFSVEFFPPKDEAGGDRILRVAKDVRESIQPDFVSITYGAGGGTRQRTFKYARILKEKYGFQVMPHLTCVGSSRGELREIASSYQTAGFCNLMALRGDPPMGKEVFEPHPDGLPYAVDLVQLLKAEFPEFSLGVAGYPEVHPEARSLQEDVGFLKDKVDRGADFVTTQLFYDNQSYFAFVDCCREYGIQVPIIPGLMPIRSADQARRFCKNIPDELSALLDEASGDENRTQAVGIDWTIRQIRELRAAGAPGVHLYIMNRAAMAREIFQGIKEEFER